MLLGSRTETVDLVKLSGVATLSSILVWIMHTVTFQPLYFCMKNTCFVFDGKSRVSIWRHRKEYADQYTLFDKLKDTHRVQSKAKGLNILWSLALAHAQSRIIKLCFMTSGCSLQHLWEHDNTITKITINGCYPRCMWSVQGKYDLCVMHGALPYANVCKCSPPRSLFVPSRFLTHLYQRQG